MKAPPPRRLKQPAVDTIFAGLLSSTECELLAEVPNCLFYANIKILLGAEEHVQQVVHTAAADCFWDSERGRKSPRNEAPLKMQMRRYLWSKLRKSFAVLDALLIIYITTFDKWMSLSFERKL